MFVNKIELTKIKVTKDRTLEAEFDEIDESGIHIATHSSRFSAIVHQDLIDSMDMMVPHFLIITELYPESTLRKVMVEFERAEALSYIREILTAYKVRQIKIGGSDESCGITMSGSKELKNKKIHNINTPFYTWEEIYEMQYGAEFKEGFNELCLEVNNYINGNKIDTSQQNMFIEKEAEIIEVF